MSSPSPKYIDLRNALMLRTRAVVGASVPEIAIKDMDEATAALNSFIADLERRVGELEAVLVYCRDNFDWEKKFRGNEYTLALEVINIVLGTPAPEVGSRFMEVMEIAKRAGRKGAL